MLRVSISSIAGDTLDVESQASDKISDVKNAVASAWSIPSSCQRILQDAEELKDDCVVENCLPSCGPSNTLGASGLEVALVVSLDGIHSNINNQDADAEVRAAKRVFALRELGILGLKGEISGITIVVNCLEEKDERVRVAAIESLSKFATKGNQLVIGALLPKLKHKRSEVKQVVLEFLGQLTEVGDHNVINEICDCFEHHVTNAELTAAAIATLGTLAVQGDQEIVVASLTKLLNNKNKVVRKVTVQAMATLAERGIVISVSVMSACLVDAQSDVRIAALKAIPKIAKKGDAEALRAVSVCVKDTETRVRLGALCAMASIAEKGDRSSFAYSRLIHDKKKAPTNREGSRSNIEDGRPRAIVMIRSLLGLEGDGSRECLGDSLCTPSCMRRAGPAHGNVSSSSSSGGGGSSISAQDSSDDVPKKCVQQ